MINRSNKPYILVSACLLGSKVRYDKKSKPNSQARLLFHYFNVIPICPEVDGGLPIPRPPSEIQAGKVINKLGEDVTAYYINGANITLQTAKKYNVVFAILKENSPSCGSTFIHNGKFDGQLIHGQGITARLLRENDIIVYSEDMIDKILESENEKGELR